MSSFLTRADLQLSRKTTDCYVCLVCKSIFKMYMGIVDFKKQNKREVKNVVFVLSNGNPIFDLIPLDLMLEEHMFR